MHILLLATASGTKRTNVNGRAVLQHGAAEAQGHTATPSLSRQHAAPPQPAAAPPAATPDASEAVESSPASLPFEILKSARRGELQQVVKWVRKGGRVDALCSTTNSSGKPSAYGLLHAAADKGHLELVRELLERGASVDLPSTLGGTALMGAALNGHLSVSYTHLTLPTKA